MSYTAADITELDDVQHTRLRPAVNLGLDVLNTALRELVDNAIEEVADPSHGGSTVTITLHADGSVSVADDGRGLPVDSDPVTGKNGIVKTLGTARAGGKFSAHADAAEHGRRTERNRCGGSGVHLRPHRRDGAPGRKDLPAEFRRRLPRRVRGQGLRPGRPVHPRRHRRNCAAPATASPTRTARTVRILFDPAVVPDSSVDISEVLLRAHAAARMSPGVHLVVVDEGWPGDDDSGPR